MKTFYKLLPIFAGVAIGWFAHDGRELLINGSAFLCGWVLGIISAMRAEEESNEK